MGVTPGVLHPKAAAPPAAAMLVVVLCWLLSFAHVTVPADVQAALIGLIGLAIGYWLPSPPPP
jgi:hypothetical protein